MNKSFFTLIIVIIIPFKFFSQESDLSCESGILNAHADTEKDSLSLYFKEDDSETLKIFIRYYNINIILISQNEFEQFYYFTCYNGQMKKTINQKFDMNFDEEYEKFKDKHPENQSQIQH